MLISGYISNNFPKISKTDWDSAQQNLKEAINLNICLSIIDQLNDTNGEEARIEVRVNLEYNPEYYECTKFICEQFKKEGYTINTEYYKTLDTLRNLLHLSQIDNIDKIRDLFFNLMITNYTGTDILIDLIYKIYDSPDLSIQTIQKIVKKGSEIEYRLMKGRRDIIHLDAFAIDTIKNIYEEKNQKNKN